MNENAVEEFLKYDFSVDDQVKVATRMYKMVHKNGENTCVIPFITSPEALKMLATLGYQAKTVMFNYCSGYTEISHFSTASEN